jgi:hypothetical protein
MPTTGGTSSDSGRCDGADLYIKKAEYTVGHMTRVGVFARRAFSLVRDAYSCLGSEEQEKYRYVLGCLEDPDYGHDLGVAGDNHDLAKGSWRLQLLCGDERPTLDDWFEFIYPHPEASVSAIHRKMSGRLRDKSLEDAMGFNPRAMKMLMCHHLRHDGWNLGYDGKDLWFHGSKVEIWRNEKNFYNDLLGPKWHGNVLVFQGDVMKYMGYGGMDVYQLTGADLPFGAEVLKWVDAYDAMTSNRKHRTNKSHCLAMKEGWKKSGSEFHPLVINAFSMIPRDEVEEISRRKAA